MRTVNCQRDMKRRVKYLFYQKYVCKKKKKLSEYIYIII